MRMKKKDKQRLLALVMAALMVISLMPLDLLPVRVKAASSFVGGVPVSGGVWDGWTWSTFGNSTSETKNTISDDKNGNVTLVSTGGKIASKQEGINYLYYSLEAGQDFILKTNATVESFTSDNQVGYGLMVRGAVGESNKTADAKPLNSAAVGAVGTDNPYNVGSYRGAASGTAATLQKLTSEGIKSKAGESYDLCIQKTGDDLFLWIDGELIKEGKASEIFITEEGTMYLGLFTARKSQVTFSETTLDYITESADIRIDSVVNPDKTQYIVGNTYKDIDLSGFSAEVTVDGEQRTITASECRITEFNFEDETENSEIRLDYYGTEISIPVTVITEVVTDIVVQYQPIKTEYALGETEIDWSGFEATVYYNSGVKKELKDLILEQDAETEVVYDFSTEGETEIVVTHTHGGEEKVIRIPVTVSQMSVASISVSAEPIQTLYYKGVLVSEDSYKKGLQIAVSYENGNSKIITSGFTVEAKDKQLDIDAVGTYEYIVTYGGKTTSYTLQVIERTVDGLKIAEYPETTTFEKGTEFTAEGLAIEAVYDSGEKVELTEGNFTVDASSFDKDTVGEYTITVNAVVEGQQLSTTFVAAVREKVVFHYEDLQWSSISFGQSTSKGVHPVVTENADGTKTITVESKEGVGKCTDDGQDGISYYYTVLNPQTDNFEMTAKITVDYFITKSSPDNQEGFGMMVRDSIGTDGDSSIYYSNAMSVGGYYGGYNVFGRYGIMSQDDTLGKVNCTLYGKGQADKVVESDPKTFILTLKKDNTGVYAVMTEEDGTVVKEIDDVMYYLPADTFSAMEDEAMYIGFMTARGAKIEVNSSDIELKVTAKAADAPQTFAEEKPVKPAASVTSLKETADESYVLTAAVNTKGLLSVKKDGETLVNQMQVEAGNYEFPVTLTVGANKFQLYFEPDGTQNITSDEAVITNVTVTRKLYEPESVIYAAPNGDSTAEGTKESPLDIQTALTYCQMGQAVYLLEGTYQLSKTTGVWKGNDGTESQRKMLFADPDNNGKVIIDFASSTGAATSYTFDFSGDYWYVKGITFLNGGGVRVGGNHNVLEGCNFAGHTNSGLSISRTDSADSIEDWPSHNQIINCNAYNNRDKSDNNADGFAAKLTCGEGNIFKGCVAAYNADDGWDLFAKGGTGPIGAVKIYDSVCFGNGFVFDETTGTLEATKGDGNGFKIGGSGIPVAHAVYDSYSFGNKTNGFTNNSNPLGTYVNCTGYNNGGSNLELHVYSGVDPQFTVTGFKSFADDSYQQVEGLTAAETESEKLCIDSVRGYTNFFYNADTKLSTNSVGVKLTAASFYSLSEFTSYINGGIESIQRDETGAIDLGLFLKYVTASDDADDNDDDSSRGSSSSTSNNNVSYVSAVTLSSSEQTRVSQAAAQVFGSSANVKQVEKTTEGLCIISKNNDVIFAKNDGTFAKNEWELVGNSWYYFDADTKAAAGWKQLGNTWYFLDAASKQMESGWLKSPYSGLWYYLDPVNGDMKSGWQMSNGKWYFMDQGNGHMKTGWQFVYGSWYYLDQAKGDCLMNTQTPDGFHVDANGAWIQ